ncbi:hypothetical protein [Planococcus sp. 107-1]|uniref:hypothetical protein n=1 Tax=Planococcus sp. 107-1 TaxID=2908840 RepID=UPI001F3F7E88|nr:hypothetical protein [Planococcus sp. 107-1]UJF25474.1 hypothetical protein L0M13_09285 [Planococcus sp. 107-1]
MEGLAEENQSLKEEMRKHDFLFVEILEEMRHKLDWIEENQKQLAVSMREKPELDSQESSLQKLESESKTIAPKKDTLVL